MRIKKGCNFPELFKKFIRSCPPLYKLLCTEHHEYRAYKAAAGFIYGFLMGIGFYYLIIVDLDFTEDGAFFFGFTVCMLFGLGIAFSSQIRCIACLTFPSLAGRVGRGVLKGLVLAILLSGPLENLTYNGKEVVRVFSCSTALTFNITKSRVKLMFQPFADALSSLKTNVHEVKDTVRTIKDVSSPIVGEVEDESEMKKIKEENDYLDEKLGDTKRSEEANKQVEDLNLTKGENVEAERYQKLYAKKIQGRCEDQFTKASNKCRKMFAKGYDACYDTVTWVAAWLLCWPMKLDFICNIAEAMGGAGKCDPSKMMDPGFGEGYTYLKHARQDFSGQFKNVRLQFKVDKMPKLADIKDAKNAAVAIFHTVAMKKEVLDLIFTILKRLIAFLVLRVLVTCQQYHDKFLRDIEFDNMYITKYFRKIDARRKLLEKHTLLPLKKIERKKLTDPWAFTPIKKERQEILKATLTLLLETLTATTLILLDRLFFEALDIVRRHARVEYIQTGKHDLKLEIKGTGLIAGLLRSLLKGFNVKKRIHIEANNEACLPQPRILLNYYIYKIYGIYFAVWLMILFQAYTQRLRRIICGYFYRKREKKRILFLYNETLKRRIGFMRFMKKKVKQMAREYRLKENLNVCVIMRIRFPKWCGFLHIFPYSRRKCLICQEPENKSKEGFYECPTYYCHMIYCLECWVDLQKTCYACLEVEDDLSSGYESVEKDDDDDDDE